MRLRILDQIHLSSVSPHTLGAGEEINISEAMGNELLAKHPDKFINLDAAPADHADQDQAAGGDQVLRQDGPTLQEFLAAGYRASAYPPSGYASRSDDAEIKSAIELEQKAEAEEQEKARREAEERAAAAAAKTIAAGGGAGAGAPGAAGGKAEPAPSNKAEKPAKNKGDAS